MRPIALRLPGQEDVIPGPPGFRFNDAATVNLSYIASQVMEYVFILSAFLVFVWALIGIIQYILAGGNKEGLAKARSRIQWAFVGFIFLLVSFALSQYIQQIFPVSVPVLPPNEGT